MTKDKALKLALDFIERVNKDGWILADFEPEMYAAITAIKEALTQPEQEPVGQLLEDAFGRGQVMWFNKPKDESMLYTTPPQRPWVGLTDEEKHEIRYSHMTSAEFIEFIEAKLKDKNA